MKKALLILSIALFGAVSGRAQTSSKRPVLTQDMVDKAARTLVIDKAYTLNGDTLSLPKGITVKFKNGSVDDGCLVGNGNKVDMSQKSPAFGKTFKVSGKWNVSDIYDSWFEFDNDSSFVSNGIIGNMLAFANDEVQNHIHFNEDRTYFFELPYKGRADIGNLVSYRMVDGTKKRNYADVYKDDFSYLRIFTIPSNTNMTINSRLQMLPTNVGAYFIFWEYGKENVSVDGTGSIYGDNAVHKYDKAYAGSKYFGEWGFIFRCFKCTNFSFKDITLGDAFGDAIIYMGTYTKNEPGRKYADGLLVENVKILGARRNGIAIGARNVTIRNCHFENCGTKAVKGTNPRCAVDFEADHLNTIPEVYCDNVLMENCTFKDNYLDVHSFNNISKTGTRTSVTISYCHFNTPLSVNSSRWMTFKNCYIPEFKYSDRTYSMFVDSYHFVFENCTFGRLTKTRYEVAKLKNKFTNCKVEKWD